MSARVNDLYTEIGQQAIEYLQDREWSQVRLYYAAVGQMATSEFVVTDKTGLAERVRGPRRWTIPIKELKLEMFQAGMGAWLSVTATLLRSPLGISFEFNFDEKPEWFGIDPSPENYLIELDRFPRPGDQIPEWFPSTEEHPQWRDSIVQRGDA